MTKILCIGSFAPYLGGAATWSPLLTALGDRADVTVLDPLDVLGAENPQAEFASAIATHIRDADVAIAHGFAAADTLKAGVIYWDDRRRFVLVNPVVSEGRQTNPVARGMRTFLRGRIGSTLVRRSSEKKIARLKRDAKAVRNELRRLFGEEPGPEILREAIARIAACNSQALIDATVALVHSDFIVNRNSSSTVDVVCGMAGLTGKTMRSRLRRLFPYARFHDLAGCGEAAMCQQPEKLLDVVLAHASLPSGTILV